MLHEARAGETFGGEGLLGEVRLLFERDEVWRACVAHDHLTDGVVLELEPVVKPSAVTAVRADHAAAVVKPSASSRAAPPARSSSRDFSSRELRFTRPYFVRSASALWHSFETSASAASHAAASGVPVRS